MMANMDTLAIDMTSLELVPFLKFPELLRLEIACKRFRSVMQNSTEWPSAVCNDIPEICMTHALKDKPDPRTLKGIIASLRRLKFFDSRLININGLKQAQELVRTIDRTREMAAAHEASGGQTQQVFVGCFRFPSVSSTSDHHETQSTTHISEPVKTVLTWQSPVMRQKTLYLKLILHKDKVYLSAKMQGHNGGSSSPKFLIDVRAVSEDTILQMHNVSVTADGGSMKSGSGLFLPRSPTSNAKTVPVNLTCVVFVRDIQGLPSGSHRLSDSLCLEKRR